MKPFSCFKPRDPFRNWSKELDKRAALWAENFNSSFKLLLLGPAGAGKTTILKQMKIIHFEGFSLEERQQKVREIRSNLLESVRELTACITASGHQINWCDKENQARLDFINGLVNLDDQTYDLYAVKIYDYSKRILTDKGVEELFNQLNQLSITHRSQYLLNRVDEIRNVNYLPNNDDILQSRRRTSDIQKLEFQVKLPLKSGSSNIQQTFCMFDVGGQRGERRKWIQVFDGVSAVMFLIDSSSFDAVDEENGRNKLRETINLFHEVWTTRFLLNSNFVLLFNKQDILREKIERGHKIEDHFPEYKLYKCQPQDKALLTRAGEKLNLFRSSGRGPPRATSSVPVGLKSAGSTPAALRDKRKSSFARLQATISNIPLSTTSFRQEECPETASSPGPTTRSTSSTCSLLQQPQPQPQPQQQHQCQNQHQQQQPQQPQQQHHQQQQQQATTISAPVTSNSGAAPPAARTTAPAGSPKLEAKSGDGAGDSAEQAYIRARCFIRDKFLQITRQVEGGSKRYSMSSIMYNSRGNVDQPKRTVCYHYTTATDTENIRDLFENLQKMVIKSSIRDLS